MLHCHFTETVIVVAARNPINELFGCFWFYENHRALNFAHDVLAHLTKLNIPYETEEISGHIDFTQCFMDGFQDPANTKILNFITQTALCKYPPLVQQLCIEYISSISHGKPDKYIVERNAQVIILTS